MRFNWWRSNGQGRPQVSPAGTQRAFSHKVRFTPRLEPLEDRTLLADGSVIVAGCTTLAGISQFGLLRYTANGILDTSFGKGGFVTVPTPGFNAAANAVVVQANGRIVIAGSVGGNFGVARVHADGLQEADFNGYGITVFNIGLTL